MSCFWWGPFVVLSCLFGVLFFDLVLGCRYINFGYWTVYIVSEASFLARGVLDCNLSNSRSVAILCLLHKTRRNNMNQLCGALPVPSMPVWITYAWVPPRCRTTQYRRIFIHYSGSLRNDLGDNDVEDVGLANLKKNVNAISLSWNGMVSPFFAVHWFLFLFLPSMPAAFMGFGSSDWECINSHPVLQCRLSLIIIIIITLTILKISRTCWEYQVFLTHRILPSPVWETLLNWTQPAFN